jgi:hypothetical protein
LTLVQTPAVTFKQADLTLRRTCEHWSIHITAGKSSLATRYDHSALKTWTVSDRLRMSWNLNVCLVGDWDNHWKYWEGMHSVKDWIGTIQVRMSSAFGSELHQALRIYHYSRISSTRHGLNRRTKGKDEQGWNLYCQWALHFQAATPGQLTLGAIWHCLCGGVSRPSCSFEVTTKHSSNPFFTHWNKQRTILREFCDFRLSVCNCSFSCQHQPSKSLLRFPQDVQHESEPTEQKTTRFGPRWPSSRSWSPSRSNVWYRAQLHLLLSRRVGCACPRKSVDLWGGTFRELVDAESAQSQGGKLHWLIGTDESKSDGRHKSSLSSRRSDGIGVFLNPEYSE